MLARRLRRRPNIHPALGQCIGFAGMALSNAHQRTAPIRGKNVHIQGIYTGQNEIMTEVASMKRVCRKTAQRAQNIVLHLHNVGPTLGRRCTNVIQMFCVCWAGAKVVVSTAAFHAGDVGSFPGLGGLKETKMFLPHPLVKLSIAGASVTER